MKFAVRVCEQVKSNAIVMVQGLATVGIGPGQQAGLRRLESLQEERAIEAKVVF